jgi:hypothetical protein
MEKILKIVESSRRMNVFTMGPAEYNITTGHKWQQSDNVNINLLAFVQQNKIVRRQSIIFNLLFLKGAMGILFKLLRMLYPMNSAGVTH